jgi:nickel-dependent lactate racemase
MKHLTLPYGSGEVAFPFPEEHLLGVLEPRKMDPYADMARSLALGLDKPSAGDPLAELIRRKKPTKVAIIVNDLTRSTPTSRLLPPILECLAEQGVPPSAIMIVIATGTHRSLTDEEREMVVGPAIKDQYHVVNHDCDAFDLVSLGTLSTGNELRINRFVAEADFRIAVGEVLFHYYAGFAGGRKSLLPGVAGRASIMANHRLMMQPGSGIGLLKGNPVHEEMLEAHARCPLDFIVNVVCSAQKQVVRLVCGDPIEAWLDGVRAFEKLNTVAIPRQAEVVIVSAGGYPKDVSLYQAHKAMEMASRAVVDGGTLVLLAECREGLGNAVFADWSREEPTPEQVGERLQREFVFGGHKLWYLAECARRMRVFLYSGLDESSCRRVFCRKLTSFERLIEGLFGRYGKQFRAWVIPHGGIVLPAAPAKA